VRRLYEPGSGREAEAIGHGNIPPPRTPLTAGRDRGADQQDFSIPPAILRLVPLAAAVGVGATFIALALLYLIYLLTHLAFFGQVAAFPKDPAGSGIGPYMIPVAVGGEIVVGLLARYGSAQIRGHGIPETMQTIATRGSRVAPRLTILKPVASAVAIGTGAPFGAEGPIIVSGGALGSVAGQLVRSSGVERRALLVGGGMAGMTAVFGTPLAAILFGLEALVFERKPRSLVLIATSCTVAEGIRLALAQIGLISAEPLFTIPALPTLTGWILLAAIPVGLVAGGASWLLTQTVSVAEALFRRLPIHWMWWPALAGIVIGLGGLVDLKALGVGYSVIDDELLGHITLAGLVLLFFVKLVIWAIGLGSGSSGGIIAPILLMGAALGAVLAAGLPGGSVPLWAALGMGATFAGMTRAPLTGIVFAAGLTHSFTILLPLAIACFTAHLVSTLVLRRSILTDKVVRVSKIPLSAEYEVDPLATLHVREVMRPDPLCLGPNEQIDAVRDRLSPPGEHPAQRVYPVLDHAGQLAGTLPHAVLGAHPRGAPGAVAAVMTAQPPVLSPTETLREAVHRMDAENLEAMTVAEGGRVVGILSASDLFGADERMLAEERERHRYLPHQD
jgi:H+/Cl- antiporter ClcA/CBS domain-containing protein